MHTSNRSCLLCLIVFALFIVEIYPQANDTIRKFSSSGMYFSYNLYSIPPEMKDSLANRDKEFPYGIGFYYNLFDIINFTFSVNNLGYDSTVALTFETGIRKRFPFGGKNKLIGIPLKPHSLLILPKYSLCIGGNIGDMYAFDQGEAFFVRPFISVGLLYLLNLEVSYSAFIASNSKAAPFRLKNSISILFDMPIPIPFWKAAINGKL